MDACPGTACPNCGEAIPLGLVAPYMLCPCGWVYLGFRFAGLPPGFHPPDTIRKALTRD